VNRLKDPSSTEDRATLLAAVRDAALAITSELSLDQCLQKLVDAARDLASARYAALGVVGSDRRRLDRFIISGMSPDEVKRIGRWPRGHGLLGVLLDDPRPLRCPRIADDPRSVGFPDGHPPMASFLGVPIQCRGEVLGHLYLTEKEGAPDFSARDEELLVLFAAHAAIAIVNARRFTGASAELQQRNRALELAEQRARLLAELSRNLQAGATEPDQLAPARIAARALELLGDACCVTLVDPPGARGLAGLDPSRLPAAERLLEACRPSLEAVLAGGPTLVAGDLHTSGSALGAEAEAVMRQERWNAVLLTALRTQTGTYGTLALFGAEPLRFGAEERRLTDEVATRVALALENAALLRRLAEALRARERFVSVAAHELKTPVAVLKGSTELLRASHTTPELFEQSCGAITRSCDRLVRLVDELLDEAQLQAGRLALHLEPTELIRLVAEVLDQHRRGETAPPALQLQPAVAELWGRWDPGRLEQVVSNLVGNALKYSPPGSPVTVSAWREDDQARLSVADRGVGIPAEERGRVFEPFFRARNARFGTARGAGLGLHLSRDIVERHGGKLWFDSVEGHGSTFHVSLPLGELSGSGEGRSA